MFYARSLPQTTTFSFIFAIYSMFAEHVFCGGHIHQMFCEKRGRGLSPDVGALLQIIWQPATFFRSLIRCNDDLFGWLEC